MSAYSPIRIQDWLGSPVKPEEDLPKHLKTALREPLVPLLLGEDSGDRAACLLFRPGRSEPALVLKIVRTDVGRRALGNEYKVLRALRARVSGEANRFFPLAISYRSDARFSGLFLEAAPGETWYRRLRGPRRMTTQDIVRLSRTLFEKLSSIADLSVTDVASDADPESIRATWSSCVDEMAANLSARRSLSAAERDTLDALKQKIGTLDTFRFQHGDLFPKNVLLSGSGRGELQILIDWAEGGSHLPPLFDEILLLSTLWREGKGLVGEAERIDHFRRVFWESTGLDGLVEEVFREGRKRWNLGSDWMREDLILLALAVYSRRIASLHAPSHVERKILMTNIEYALTRRAGA